MIEKPITNLQVNKAITWKKSTSTILLLLSLSVQSTALPTIHHKSAIQTIDHYVSCNKKIIDNPARLTKKIDLRTPDSDNSETIHAQKQTKMKNATILHQANEFVKKGNYESFLTYCTPNTKWVFVGERTLQGIAQVRAYMKEFYLEPPVFTAEKTIEEGDDVTVMGEITLKDANGTYKHYEYCDVWHFSKGKIAALKAFVIEKTDNSSAQ